MTRKCLLVPTLLALSLALGGCDADWFFEKFYSGTSKGFALCKKRGTGQGLRLSTVMTQCGKSHQQNIQDLLIGKARYEKQYTSSPVLFAGEVTNRSSEYIVTEFTVVITRSDPAGVERKTFSGEWIEPNQSAQFHFLPGELSHKPEDPATQHGKFSWATTDVRGVKVSF